MPAVVEICVESLASAIAAQQGGASRVELCRQRSVGGLTPSEETTHTACLALNIPVHVLIRPQEGSFLHDQETLQIMISQIESAKRLGAAGVVLGLLQNDHTIDRDQTASMIALARPLTVTFHKAFDQTPDPFQALNTLISLGIRRVLTSGQAETVREGIPCLAALQRRAQDRIVIMAGGAIHDRDLSALAPSGIREIHSGSYVSPDGPTDPERVRALVTTWSRLVGH